MSELPKSFKTVAEYRVARAGVADRQRFMDNPDVTVTILPEAGPSASIQAALDLFDAESGMPEPVAPLVDHAGVGISQFIGPAEPQETRFVHAPDERRREDLAGGSFIERNGKGQVTRTRSSGGDISMFVYDVTGALERFSYAGMDWRADGEGAWIAQDRQSDFRIDGKVEIVADGSIRVTRADMSRLVKLSGMRIDEYTNGTQSESRKLKNSASPYDLLAKAKPVGSVWRTPGGRSPAQGSDRMKLENLFRESVQPGIPDAVCNTALAALMDGAEDVPMPEPDETFNAAPPKEKPLEVVKRHTTECFNKAALWLCDKVKGATSAEQIPYLDNLAEIYMRKKQYDLAELTYLRSLHIKEQFYGLRQPELAGNLYGLGQVHREWGNLQRAEQFFQQALELHDKGIRKQMFLLSHKMATADKVKPAVESMIACIWALFALYERQMKISGGNKLCNKAMTFWAELTEKHSDSIDLKLLSVIESHVVELSYKGAEAFGFSKSMN